MPPTTPLRPETHKTIGFLYGVERRAKKMPAAERLKLRIAVSVPMLNTIFDWCRDKILRLMASAHRHGLNEYE